MSVASSSALRIGAPAATARATSLTVRLASATSRATSCTSSPAVSGSVRARANSLVERTPDPIVQAAERTAAVAAMRAMPGSASVASLQSAGLGAPAVLVAHFAPPTPNRARCSSPPPKPMIAPCA